MCKGVENKMLLLATMNYTVIYDRFKLSYWVIGLLLPPLVSNGGSTAFYIFTAHVHNWILIIGVTRYLFLSSILLTVFLGIYLAS